MFTAKVYTVMIGSLSGTMEEVFTAKEVVRKYNQEKTESTGKLFLPVEWSMKPQDLKNVDVLIGIVGNWIDKPEFIEDCLKAGKKVKLFFNSFHDPQNSIQTEVDDVEEFRLKIKNQYLCYDYNGPADFEKVLSSAMDKTIYQ